MVLLNFFRNLKIINNGPGLMLRKIILWCIGLFISFTILFKFTEGVGWEESIWQAWQTFTTVGYGNQPAVTTLGRIVTIILSTLGIAFVGALFGAAFDYKQYLKDQKRLGYMKNPFKNGYVILNYPGDSFLLQFINELRSVEADATICVVDEKLQQLPEDVGSDTKIHFVKGSLLDESTYINANVKEAKVVIVNPIDPQSSQSDASTKTIVGLLQNFLDEATRIIHLIVDQKNRWMFESSKSTAINADLEVLALVQECQDEYSSTIIENLLHNTSGANPQTVTPVYTIGWSWGELQEKCGKAQMKYHTPCNILAIIKNGEVDSCPYHNTIINEGDKISMIAYESFNWNEFEKVMIEFG